MNHFLPIERDHLYSLPPSPRELRRVKTQRNIGWSVAGALLAVVIWMAWYIGVLVDGGLK